MEPLPIAVDPFSPTMLGPIEVRNRFIKAATFEGPARDNSVGDRLVEFHRRIASGGAALTTVAYCAVSPEGSTDGRNHWPNDGPKRPMLTIGIGDLVLLRFVCPKGDRQDDQPQD